jgi:TorA maturation chaperone TorD
VICVTTPSVSDARGTLVPRLDVLAAGCAFVARTLLAPPDPDLLARVGAEGFMATWPLRDEDSRAGADLVARGAADPLLDIARDYQRLFVGPGPLLAPPYESVHTTRDRLLFEAPTLEVRAAYRAFGQMAPALGREPDDHLGLELDFLAHLCGRALDAVDTHDELALDTTLAAQQEFLHRHLGRWGADCFRLVQQHARTSFYRGVALLGLGVLAEAEDLLRAP